MEGIRYDCEFLRRIAPVLPGDFTLVDIGCSGGVDALWRTLGPCLRVVGFDPNLEEVRRLNETESNPRIRYVSAFVGLPPDHPLVLQRGGKWYVTNNPWDRLSAAHTAARRSREIENLPHAEKTPFNTWNQQTLADPSHSIYLPDYFAEHAFLDIDMIKLDVDGADFEILQSLGETFDSAKVTALGMEVNYAGSDSETDHTFHNTDRYLRRHGFDLFALTVRHYSSAALPSRYLLTIPAQTESGRPLQGDALYIRDLCSPANAAFAAGLSVAKILKTAGILASFNLADAAAEILLAFRSKLAGICAVDELLDVLALQIQESAGTKLSYRQYIAEFENDADSFYPARKRS